MDPLLQYLIFHEVFVSGNDDNDDKDYKGTLAESDDLSIDNPDAQEEDG